MPEYHLRQNGHRVWEIHWSEQHPAQGWRTRRVSTRTRDEAEAKAFLLGWMNRQPKLRAQEQARTVAGLIDLYLAAREGRMSPSQAQALKPVRALLGDLAPRALDGSEIERYRAERPVADPTVRRELGALVAALNWAQRARHITSEDMPWIELPPAGQPRDVWLTEAQQGRLWDLVVGSEMARNSAKLSRFARFMALAIDTAARRTAIEDLTWDRVTWPDPAQAGHRGLLDFRDPSRATTKKRRVPLPIATRLLPVLRRAYAERDPRDRHVVGAGSIRYAWETGITQLAQAHPEFAVVTPHVLRHTWATLAAGRGVTMREIAGVLGDTQATVERHYAHHAPAFLQGAIL